jgi:hypothetical protein
VCQSGYMLFVHGNVRVRGSRGEVVYAVVGRSTWGTIKRCYNIELRCQFGIGNKSQYFVERRVAL